MHALIAVQIAFCFVVHFAAGLFSTTFDKLSHQPTGFSAERIINLETLPVRPQPPVYWEQVAEHLRTLPGVESVALTDWPLMSGESAGSDDFGQRRASEAESVSTDLLNISPGWFDTMKIPIIAGRDFRRGRHRASPAVTTIVNQAFAKQYFDGQNPGNRKIIFERRVNGGARTRVQIVELRPRRSIEGRHAPCHSADRAYVPFQSDAAKAFQPK